MKSQMKMILSAYFNILTLIPFRNAELKYSVNPPPNFTFN